MKIVKYPQSCFMIEANETKILIDPGGLSFDEKFLLEWNTADYVFITHKHGDHCFLKFLENFNGIIYSTQEVQKACSSLNIKIVKNGDEINLGEDVKVNVLESIHGYLPRLTHNNLEIEESVGFMFELEGKRIYHMGDAVCFKTDEKHICDILLAPVSGHGLVMSAYEVAQLANEVKAKQVIPMHMDNPDFPVNINEMKKTFEDYDINYKILAFEEILEV
ncbi:MAG: MBL fold metallo-hydrolase [Alphaproteobacteria bacterium]